MPSYLSLDSLSEIQRAKQIFFSVSSIIAKFLYNAFDLNFNSVDTNLLNFLCQIAQRFTRDSAMASRRLLHDGSFI
jgi:hypothetical protein